MSRKLTLIEYDADIYAGDAAEPDIQDPNYNTSALGGETAAGAAEQTEAERIDAKVAVQLSDLHDYLIGISSSSSSSSSSSTGA
jgi:hypothetical protein